MSGSAGVWGGLKAVLSKRKAEWTKQARLAACSLVGKLSAMLLGLSSASKLLCAALGPDWSWSPRAIRLGAHCDVGSIHRLQKLFHPRRSLQGGQVSEVLAEGINLSQAH